MKLLFSKHKVFFIVYGLFLMLLALATATYEKTELHLFLNGYHHTIADSFFKNLTYLGDGVMVAILGVVFLLISKRGFLLVVLSGMLSGFVTQFLKKVVFGSMPRPSLYFEELQIPLYIIDGVNMHSNFSFPSGHSTAAFAMATSLMLFQKSNKFDLLFILSAILVAYSRVYLSQHFLVDIAVGSLIGVSVSTLVYLLLHSTKMIFKINLDKPLISFARK